MPTNLKRKGFTMSKPTPPTPAQLAVIRKRATTQGQMLQTLRKLAGQSGPVAAVGVGLNPGTLNAIENNTANPTQATLAKVAAYYGVGIRDLFLD